MPTSYGVVDILMNRKILMTIFLVLSLITLTTATNAPISGANISANISEISRGAVQSASLTSHDLLASTFSISESASTMNGTQNINGTPNMNDTPNINNTINNTCFIPNEISDNYTLNCSCDIIYSSRSGFYLARNNSQVIFPPNFKAGTITFYCGNRTIERVFGLEDSSSYSLNNPAQKRIIPIKPLPIDLLVKPANLTQAKQLNNSVEWKEYLFVYNKGDADYNGCIELTLPKGSFDIKVRDNDDVKYIRDYSSCYNISIKSKSIKVLDVEFETPLIINITDQRAVIHSVFPSDSFNRSFSRDLSKSFASTIIVYQNTSLTYHNISIPRLSREVVITKELHRKQESELVNSINHSVNVLNRAIKSAIEEQQLDPSDYYLTNDSIILKNIEPDVRYIIRQSLDYKILACTRNITIGKPVFWSCKVLFENKLYNVSYETPPITKDENLSFSSCGWLNNVRVKTDFANPYSDFDVFALTPSLNFSVNPPLDFYVELGTNKTKFHIPKLIKEFRFVISSGCSLQRSPYPPLTILNTSHNTSFNPSFNTSLAFLLPNASINFSMKERLKLNRSNESEFTEELAGLPNLTSNFVIKSPELHKIKNFSVKKFGKYNNYMINLMLELNKSFTNTNLHNANISIELPSKVSKGIEVYVWKRVKGMKTKYKKYIWVPSFLIDKGNKTTLRFVLQDGVLDDDNKQNGQILINNSIFFSIPDFNVSINKSRDNKKARIVIKENTSLKRITKKALELATEQGDIESIKVVPPEDTINPPNKSFEYKLIKFRIANVSKGGRANILIHLDKKIPYPQLWKFNPNTAEWYSFPFTKINDTTLKLSILDGGLGDDDGIANGVIEDDLGVTNSWWNNSWLYRSPINLTYAGQGNLTDYQINLTIDTQSLISEGKMNDDCSDIRFTYWNDTASKEQEIPYWIESGCNTTNTKVWVKVPFIRNVTYGNETIFLYYGNTTSVQSESNGTATFVFFSNGNSLAGWTNNGATVNSNNGNPSPSLEATGGTYAYIDANLTPNMVIDLDMYVISGSTDLCNFYFLTDSSGAGQMFRLEARSGYPSGFGSTSSWTSWTQPASGSPVSAGVWHHVKIVLNSTQARGYIDGVEVSSSPYTFSNNGGYIAIHGDSSVVTGGDFDNIRIRKYVNPEPTVSMGGEEYVARLNVTINYPTEGTVLTRYNKFWLNSSIYCERGNCSDVFAYPEYISTANQHGEISDSSFTNYTEKVNVTSGNTLKLEPMGLSYPWWNNAWNYRQCFNISSTSEQTDYQVKLFFSSSDLGSNFDWNNKDGIRFIWYNVTGNNYEEIPYWIEELNANSNVTFWIKVPELIAGNTTVCMYYGNITAVESKSDPYSVFYFYSDGSSLNQFDIKQAGSSGSYSIDNSYGNPAPSFKLSVSGGTADSSTWTILGNTSNLLPNNYAVEADINITGSSPLIDVLTNFKAASGPFYVFRLDARSGAYDLIGYYDAGASSTTQLNTTSITSPTNIWLHMKAVRLNDMLKLYKDSSLEATYNLSGTSYLITGGGVAITTDGATSTDWFDNVIVRKYAEPEPSVSHIYSEENQTYKPSGYYISRIVDLGSNDIDFTNIYWIARTNENTSVKVYTRSSNDASTWSPWYLETNNTDVDAPNRRYFQYKVELSTTNTEQTPELDKIVVSYTYTAPAFITMQSSGTDFTTSPLPYDCGELTEANSSCNVSWQVTPHEKGNYTIRVWVNSTDSRVNPAQSQWINVSVYEQTYITELSVEPTVQYKGGDVTVSARLLDSLSNPISGAVINFTDETSGITIGNDTTDSNGYATILYHIPYDTSIGYHTIRAEYSQNDTLFYFGSWNTKQFKVSSSPEFHQIILSNSTLGTKEKEKIQVNVTDEIGLDNVILYLTYPNGTELSALMSYNSTTGLYEYTTEELWQAGDYNFYIWANNTDGMSNSSWQESFAVKVLGLLDIALEKNNYKNFELVKLSIESDEWDFLNYTYRQIIYVYSNTSDKNIPIGLNINTSKLISEGKLNANCSDIRFAQTKRVEELPLTISNPYGEVKYNFTFPLTITDKETLSKMSPDGRDIRIFSYETSQPYAEEPDIPFWVESVSTSEAKIWVRLSQLPLDGSTLYLYYGNTSAQTKSNYTAVFKEIIGEAGIVYSNDTWVDFKYLNASNEPRFVFSSLDSYYGSDEAFSRITEVNQTSFHVFIQESEGLDQSHADENIAWLAVKDGTWIVNGKLWQVGNLSRDGSYSTLNFYHAYDSTPIVLSQIESLIASSPTAKTRMDTPSKTGINIKIEPGGTTDTYSTFENVGWLAAESGIYDAGATIEVGEKYHNQPNDVSSTAGWTSYSLSAGFSTTPAVIAKIQTEYGGDNTHERIRNIGTASFEYAMEEENGHDGAHTYEWNGYFAVEPNKPIYGAKYYSIWPSVVEQTENRKVISITTTQLPFWVERGCNSENTSIWVNLAYLSPGKNKIYMYYGNPSDGTVNDTAEDEIKVFTTDKIASYLVLGVQGSNLDVASYADNNEITLGSTTTTLNAQGTYTFASSDVSIGNLLYSKAPVSSGTQSSGDGAPLTPLAFKGKLFVFPVSRYNPIYFDIYALEDTDVEVWVSNPAGSTWQLNDSFTLSEGSATSKSYAGSSNTNAAIELTYMINSTGDIIVFVRQNTDDYLPLAPAGKELYLEPSNYLELAAVENGTSVTIYYSDGSTPTILALNAGEGYTSSSLGSDGTAPAVRIVADKPVFAYQLADSDGTEATPALPLSLMDKVFVFPQDAEYFVAVTPAGETTECTLYNSTGSVRAGPWTASATPNEPGKIGYGTGQDGTTYIYAGDKLVCNNTVYVYYEQATNDAETLIYGPKAHQNYINYNYTIAYEEDKWVNLENNGDETIRGYLWAIVQRYDSTTDSWINLPPAVINDRATSTLREIAPNSELNLTQLWQSAGGWNTSDNPAGKYRVVFELTDEDGNPLYDYNLNTFKDYSIFEIASADVSLVNLTHPSKYYYSMNEYETGDKIDWINLSVKASNNTAINTNIHLTLIANTGSYAGFGPNNETYSCGTINENQYCNATFDNSSNGYYIPTNLAITSENYTLKVNITLDNGPNYMNTTHNITVYNLPSVFKSTEPSRLYQNGNPVYYNFTLKNLWSKNITNVKVKINCPTITGLTCECSENPGSDICEVGNLTSQQQRTVSFKISATEDTPVGDYVINASVNYTNPLGNQKYWQEQKPQTLEIRTIGIMEITPYEYPTNITRGESFDFRAYANNTGSQTANEAWLAYTSYPQGWVIINGQENVSQLNIAPGEFFWNNVTFNTSISSSLGSQTVELKSASDLGQNDFKHITIYVYGNTTLELWVNDTNVSKSEAVRIYARLLWDNGTGISNEQISFSDETESSLIGSATTNASGIAFIDYSISNDLQLGLHIINATFDGDPSIYANPSNNKTQINVGLKPVVNSIEFLPGISVGYGTNLTIKANVTDDQNVSWVKAIITTPSGKQTEQFMQNIGNDIYETWFNDTWVNGTYNVTILAEDSYGSQNSSNDYFEVKIDSIVLVKTEKDVYYPAENIKLERAPLFPFAYKIPIYIQNSLEQNLTEYQINLLLNTSKQIIEGKMKSDCSDILFTWLNASSNKEEKIPYYLEYGCNSNTTSVWVKVPVVYPNTNTTIYMYYGNDYAQSESNETAVFSYDKNETTFYVVSFVSQNSPLDVVAFENGTSVIFNGNSVRLDEGQTYQFTAGGNASLGIAHDKPIFGAFTNDITDAIHPISWAGRKFVYRTYRGTEEWYIFAPFGDAQVNITDAYTGSKTTVYVSKGTAYNANVDITDGSTNSGSYSVIIESNVSVLVQHAAPNEGDDSRLLYPASTELYGIPSQYLEVAALEDGTAVNVYCSNGNTYSWNLNRGGTAIVSNLGSEGSAPACVIKANKAIGVDQLADSDGTETTTFLPLKELDRIYYLPQGTQYVAIAAPFATTCKLYGSSGNLLDTQSGTPSGNAPAKIYFGSTSDGTNIQPSSYIVCNNPVFAYYEYSNYNDETNIFGMKANRKYAGVDLNYTIGKETTSGSAIINYGNSFKGYLIATVEKNVSGVWHQIDTLLNDTSTNTLRDFSYEINNISNIIPAWNPEGDTGEFRIVVKVADKNSSLLNTTNGKLIGSYIFNVTQVSLRLNISQMRIYEAPNNEHGGGTLVDSGINKTFNLEAGKTYRFEIDVDVLNDSQPWQINESNVTLYNLNQSWTINTTNNVWYLNQTDSVERLGGDFNSGVLRWDTAANDGGALNGTKVTFYFIVNLSNAMEEERNIEFEISASSTLFKDFDTINIYQPDITPPVLYDGTYGLNATDILRGESVLAYARWDEEISNAKIEYNSTSSLLANYSIALPSPNPENWTNYTIETTSIWLLGTHHVKIYASDIAGNWNGTLPYLNLNVYGLAYVKSMSVNNTSPLVNTYIKASCLVKDDTNDEVIANYNVSFYYDDNYIGSALTNASGYATFVYQVSQPGAHIIKCNISNSSENYYKVDSRSYKEESIYVNELEPPQWHERVYPSSAHKGDYVNLAVNWTDNFALNYATLATNASGTWSNVSSIALSGTQKWANFSYQIPPTMQPGYLAWKQYANDTSGNENVTPANIIEVWGWAKVQQAIVSPSSIQLGNSTLMSCQIVDANYTSYAIEGYNVSFYLDNTYLGWNTTNATGYAVYHFTPSEAGVFTVKCNISDYAEKKYNASGMNEGSDTLTVTQTSDTTPPAIVDGNYGLNTTTIYRYDTVKIYGQWNEEIDKAWVEYNVSPSAPSTIIYFEDSGVPGNWTNYTITTDDSWTPGIHAAKLYANDTSGNINDTLNYLSFEMWGRSAVYWVSPADFAYRGNTTIICNVTDYDTGEGVAGYTVQFYNSTDYLGSNTTNSTGFAHLTIDTSSYTPGTQTFYCKIVDDNEKYYKAIVTQASRNVDIRGKLNVTITAPEENAILERGKSYWLNSTTKDEFNSVVTPDSANWYDDGLGIASGESVSWQIPLNHLRGETTIKINVTKAHYDSDEDLRDIYIYGHAQAKWMSPIDGSYPQGRQIKLVCFVNDTDVNEGIANYPVKFYYNGTLISSVLTNSSGYATALWDTTGLEGIYNVSCVIQDNSTLYYLASYPSDATLIEIYIDNTPPTVNIISPENISYASSSINLNYTASDDYSLDSCWYSLDGGANTSLPDCQNITLTSLTDGFHNIRVYANDSAGNVGYDEQYFTVDTQAPIITIVSPLNTTYANSWVWGNLSVNEKASLCWYSLDNGANTSMQNATPDADYWYANISSLTDGLHELTFYCNDTAGNKNSSNVTFTVDTTLPQTNLLEPANGTVLDTSSVAFKCNASDNIQLLNVSLLTNETGAFEVVQTNMSGINGNYTFSRSMQDGIYLWSCMVCDTVHCSFANENRTIIIDTQGPNVTIYSPQNTSYNTNSIWLNYTAQDLTLQECWYSLDGGANISLSNCANITLTGLSDGSHVVRVYANDSLGREGHDEVSFTVDTTPPQLQIISPQNNTEYATNIIDLNYTASDNIKLTWCAYSLDNGANITLTNCENTTLTGLENGMHNITVYAKDIAGNENSSYVNFSVNSVAPVVNIVHPEDNAYFSSQDVDLNYTAEDADLDQCWYSLDGGVSISLPYCENTTLTGLSEGIHTVKVYANDSQSHESYDEVTFYVDTVAPNVSITSPENKPYNTSSVDLDFVASDTNLDSCWYSLDNGVNITLPNCANTTLIGLSDSFHNIRVYANDSAGNVGYDEQNFSVDTQAPEITIISPENTTYLTNTISVNYTVRDNIAIEDCWYKLDAGESVYLSNCENFTLSNIIDGTHTLTIYANDTASNTNSSSVTFTIDTQGPIITFVPPTPKDNQALDSNWTYINITTNEIASIALLEWNYTNGTVVNYTMNALTQQNFWFNLTNLEDGTYYYRVYANDSYAHLSTTELRSVRISTSAPIIDILSPSPTVYNDTNYLPLNVVSNKEIIRWWFSLNERPNETFEPNTSIAAKPGTNTLYVYANDTTGKIGWNSVSFTVNATSWQDYFATQTGIEQNENVSVRDKLSIDFCWYIGKECLLYRKPIIINNSEVLTDVQLNLSIDTQSLISVGKMNESCKDIRFTWFNETNGKEQQIPYYVESGCNTTSTKIWIRVPEINIGNTTIYMYYGAMQAESESNSSAVFKSYTNSQTCSGSTTGGSCPIAFNAPAGYEFYSATIDLEAAGDMGYGGAYADNLTCNAGETYERFNVTIESNCYGTYSPGIDGCTLTHISTWPKNVTQDIKGKTSFNLIPQVNSKVNADPGSCGFYYYFRANLTAELRKQASVTNVYEKSEEARKRNAFTKSILIQPKKIARWQDFCANYSLNGEALSFEIYNATDNMLLNCTTDVLSTGCCNLSSITANAIYIKTSFLTDQALVSPEVYHYNVSWNTSSLVTFKTYNRSFEPRSNTYGWIYDRNNNLVAEGYTPLTADLEIYENYTYKSYTSISAGLQAEIYNINITKPEFTLEEQIVENYSGYLPANVSDITPVYALNDSSLTFEKAKLVIPKNSLDIQYVLHCLAWNFTNANCSQWEFINTTDLEGYEENSTHIWFNVSSFEAYAGASAAKDLSIKNITFNTSTPKEGDNISITLNVTNSGNAQVNNVKVQLNRSLWNGTTWLFQKSEEKITDVAAKSYVLVNFSWIAQPGTYNFTAYVDPDNSIPESNESNNEYSTTYTVSEWNIFYGHTNGTVLLADATTDNFTMWIPAVSSGNLYFADSDFDVNFSALKPLNGTDDLKEADSSLNITGFNDSIKALWDKNNDNIADAFDTFTIRGVEVQNVPIVNTTNSSNFQTGILWDSSTGDSSTEYDGSQYLVFVTKIKNNLVGKYGVYDYEIRIPSALKKQVGTNNLVSIYLELT